MKEIGSYPTIYSLGHKAVRDIFQSPTLIQEKVDGSQLSFMRRDGAAYVRSKNQMLYFDNPEKMFAAGMECIFQTVHDLTDDWVYRGEYLEKPNHNVLKYDRVPNNHIALYDVQIGHETYLGPAALSREAERLGFEVVPFWAAAGPIERGRLAEYLNTVSFLGGTPIEGVVIKNYDMFDPTTKKVLMAKYVSEVFKEVHQKKQYKTGGKDIIQTLIERFKTTARWQKAVQHLRETGSLEDSPTDIGMLIKEVSMDVHSECKDEIKEMLFKWAWKQINRGVTAGLPEWYKEKLMEKQFENVLEFSNSLETDERGIKGEV